MPKVPFYKTRCLICWKNFLTPKYLDQANCDYIFFQPEFNKYGTFSWKQHPSVQSKVAEILSKSEELQFQNDESKGRLAIRIVGLLADEGEWRLVSFGISCPRCGLRLCMTSSQIDSIVDVPELGFSQLAKRNINLIAEKLMHHTKGA